MTIDQTRQLAVEFERRINAIDQSTESVSKLDTDTIYAYLNQFQQQYIQQMYIADGQLESGTRGSIRVSDITKPFIKQATISPTETENTDEISTFFNMPSDYFMYIRSNSAVTGTYKNLKELNLASNTVLKQDDVSKVILQYYNSDGIIRNPLAVIRDNELQVIHDKYTDIHYIELTYFKKPNDFNIIDNMPCELPFECFDDLVSGAVELYFQYKYKVALANNQRRRQRKQEETEA